VEIKFAWIPPGTLARGNFVVTLDKGFYMGIYPVTQAQWKAVMGYNPSHFVGDEQRPVENVYWFDCQNFCTRLGKLLAKPIRLPTEAEWEYACRAGVQEFFCGDGEEALKKIGWYAGNSSQSTHPVGKLAANPWGLFDMHGNVLEWCQDWFAAYPTASQKNPVGPSLGVHRVLRGGSYKQSIGSCRAADRHAFAPADRKEFFGLRVCFSID
jgi:formylglycine-generating enzyme required for sulfatase activity